MVLGNVDRHSSQLVDERRERVEVDDGDVVDREPGEILDRLHGEGSSAERVRRVDLVRAVLAEIDSQIPGNGEIGDPV